MKEEKEQPSNSALEGEQVSRPASTLLAEQQWEDLLTSEAREYSDMRKHITLSPKQKTHLNQKQVVQRRAPYRSPGRTSGGQNSIIESHETFGDLQMKANVPGASKPGEDKAGAKKNTVKMTNNET